MGRGKSKRPLTILLIRIFLLFALSEAAWAELPATASLDEQHLLEVKVYQLGFDSTNKQPLVFLSDSRGQRALPICIGLFEASAIHSEMQGITHRRPLTHDLLERIIHASKGKIHRVIITHQKEGVYYATIEMDRDGSRIEIDARPSDSIVMALKFESPIYVTEALFKEMAIPMRGTNDLDDLYGLTLQELTEPLAEYFSFASTRGVLVSDVRKGSLAERDGIERGDIFIEVEGKSVEDIASLKEMITTSERAVQAKIFRKAKLLSITLHPR
jgi:bifunctional DNase/RNase